MQRYVKNPDTDLFSPIPHGAGQTVLREVLVVADHGESLDESLEARGYAYDHGEFLEEPEIRIP